MPRHQQKKIIDVVEAFEQVKHKLDEWMRGAKIVEVNVPTGNPWLDFAGSSAEDCEQKFQELRALRLHIGTLDLRIENWSAG
jgi:hypothetical protein